MKHFTHIRSLGMGFLAAASTLALVGMPYYVHAQRNLPPQQPTITTVAPYFLLKGVVTGISGSLAIVKTADYGPGRSRGQGVHSQAMRQGRSYLVDLSNAVFQATDGTGVNRQGITVGDSVVMLTSATPGPAQKVGNITMSRYGVFEVIRNDQTPR